MNKDMTPQEVYKLLKVCEGRTVVQHIIAASFAYIESKANNDLEDMKYWEESIAFWSLQLTKNG